MNASRYAETSGIATQSQAGAYMDCYGRMAMMMLIVTNRVAMGRLRAHCAG
jgi:hypothetical protein